MRGWMGGEGGEGRRCFARCSAMIQACLLAMTRTARKIAFSSDCTISDNFRFVTAGVQAIDFVSVSTSPVLLKRFHFFNTIVHL